MAFWAIKSQNFEKVYRIRIKNHAILHLLHYVFFILLAAMYSLRSVQKAVGRTKTLPKKLSEGLQP